MKIVIDVPEKVYNHFCRGCRFFDEVEEAIIAITDGTPLQKGQWIERVERDDWDDFEEVWYECDQCHIDSERASNYCPNCGAKMVEGSEE